MRIGTLIGLSFWLALGLSLTGCALVNPDGFTVEHTVTMRAVGDIHQTRVETARAGQPLICKMWSFDFCKPAVEEVAGS
jgi:hypothetical protein